MKKHKVKLRDYQKKVIQKLENGYKETDSIMLQMPTGTGKTTVFSQFIFNHLNEDEKYRVLVLVHRKELVDQIVNRLHNFGIESSIIMAGHQENHGLRVQVASIQSLSRRGTIPWSISLIVVDEAHHIKAKSYENILDRYKEFPFKLLGVTATPIRMDGRGFSDVFNVLVTSDSIPEFISNGHLAELKHLAVSEVDLSNIDITNYTRDYDINQLGELMSQLKVIGSVVEAYQKYSYGKKALVFCVNRAHSEKVCEQFREIGVKAQFIDSETKKVVREKTVEAFKASEIQVLTNVNIFTEGFDCPDIDAVILARPTKSTILFFQQIGRVMRPKPNNEPGLILDCASLHKEHGLVTDNYQWSLEGVTLPSNTLVSESISSDGTRELKIIELSNYEMRLLNYNSLNIWDYRPALCELLQEYSVFQILPKSDFSDFWSINKDFLDINNFNFNTKELILDGKGSSSYFYYILLIKGFGMPGKLCFEIEGFWGCSFEDFLYENRVQDDEFDFEDYIKYYRQFYFNPISLYDEFDKMKKEILNKTNSQTAILELEYKMRIHPARNFNINKYETFINTEKREILNKLEYKFTQTIYLKKDARFINKLFFTKPENEIDIEHIKVKIVREAIGIDTYSQTPKYTFYKKCVEFISKTLSEHKALAKLYDKVKDYKRLINNNPDIFKIDYESIPLLDVDIETNSKENLDEFLAAYQTTQIYSTFTDLGSNYYINHFALAIGAGNYILKLFNSDLDKLILPKRIDDLKKAEVKQWLVARNIGFIDKNTIILSKDNMVRFIETNEKLIQVSYPKNPYFKSSVNNEPLPKIKPEVINELKRIIKRTIDELEERVPEENTNDYLVNFKKSILNCESDKIYDKLGKFDKYINGNIIPKSTDKMEFSQICSLLERPPLIVKTELRPCVKNINKGTIIDIAELRKIRYMNW